MIIMNDIHDATMMRKKLQSILRRSKTFNHSKSGIQLELMLIIKDLTANIESIDQMMSAEE